MQRNSPNLHITHGLARHMCKLKGYGNFIFLALILIHLIPIWIFDYFPSQDGPAHIENAGVIRDYQNPERSILRTYYTFNKNFTPTWLGHLILVGLMYIVPAVVAEKIFLTLYVILFPISVRYALSAMRSDNSFLAYMSFPFIYNYTLHLGFYSFCLSLSLFFFMVGYWLKNRDHFNLQKILILTCLSMLLYFFHVVSLAMAYLGIAIFTIWLILLDLVCDEHSKKSQFTKLWKILQRRALTVFLAFLPTLILLMIFIQPRGVKIKLSRSFGETLYMLRDLLQIESLVSFHRPEFWISLALGIVFWAVFLHIATSKIVHRQFDRLDGLIFVILAYVLIFMMSPESISKFEIITPRLNLYPFFALIIWFGTYSYHEIVKRTIALVTIAITLISLSFLITKYAELNDYMAEYLSGQELIQPNTTLLPISFSSNGFSSDGKTLALKAKPFLHTSGYIAAERSVVEFTNYEAGEFDWFPIVFRQEFNPYLHIAIGYGLEAEPPRIEFLTYPERTGGQVDYVLVWAVREHQRNLEATRSIFRQLKEGYRLIYTSPRGGMMKLYQRKESYTPQ